MLVDKKITGQYPIIPSTLRLVDHIEDITDITDPEETETYKIKSDDEEDKGTSESKTSISHYQNCCQMSVSKS